MATREQQQTAQSQLAQLERWATFFTVAALHSARSSCLEGSRQNGRNCLQPHFLRMARVVVEGLAEAHVMLERRGTEEGEESNSRLKSNEANLHKAGADLQASSGAWTVRQL